MGRIAMKIAYDGGAFHGQARQPGLLTVEGEILIALARASLIGNARSSRFQSASRTDQGVSALGNVVAFDTAPEPPAVLRAFNSKARGVWAWAGAKVPPDFNARRALIRWYQYALPQGHDPERLSEILGPFVGKHDFRNFTRDRTRTDTTIEYASAIREGDEVLLDFRASSFRWNLVRRIVAAALQVERGKRSLAEVEQALEGSKRVDFGLAPPEPLTLMNVEYDMKLDPIEDLSTRDRVWSLVDERSRSARFAKAVARKFDLPNL